MGTWTLVLQGTLGVITPEGWGRAGIYVPIPAVLVGAAARKHWFSGALGWPWGWAKRAPAIRAFSLRQRNAGAGSWKLGHPTLKSLSARGCGQGTGSIFFKHLFYLFSWIFLYLAVPHLHCGMRDLPSSLLHVGSFYFLFSCDTPDL